MGVHARAGYVAREGVGMGSTKGLSHSFEKKTVVSRDGTRIAYDAFGTGDQVLMLANGLGGRTYAWEPLVERFHRTHRILCWDYRGLFDSFAFASGTDLAVERHVDDAIAILDQERCTQATFVGWSMGVQVSLAAAARHPERVRSLVLLNGTYGRALRTVLQPFGDVPLLERGVVSLVDTLLQTELPMPALRSAAAAFEPLTVLAFSATAGRRAFSLRPTLRHYTDDVLGVSFENYLRLFQSIDDHSAYDALPGITTPTLVISGALDPLTPARQGAVIARRLPNAEHVVARAGHFALLERPDIVVPAIATFLNERLR